jgi:hypothetical protein
MAGQPRQLGGAHGVVGMADGQLRLPPERQSGIGGHHAAGGALQQPGGQFALQSADLLAERRRPHPQLQRSAPHAALRHHADKIAQLS